MAVTERHRILLWLAACGIALAFPAQAAVLPEDRTDLMYHYYDGGGVTVSGPAMLIRKRASDSVSVSAHYYMDMVSGASIDVVTTASPYRDTRNQYGFGMDYLYGNSLMSATLTNSEEKDFKAESYTLGVSHELFKGLTTLSLGYGQGHDTVMRVNESFQDVADRYQFRLGLTQILSRRSLLNIAFEDVAENGYLNNPYRTARVNSASVPEIYPRTRDSQAIAFRYVHGFARDQESIIRSLRVDYRYFRDTWGIRANTASFTLQRQFNPRWTGEFRARYYEQTAADFYSDNFSALMTYMARDKELSTFNSYTFGLKVGWTFAESRFLFFNRASLNLAYDFMLFDYKDFTDVRTGEAYSFGANVLQLYVSGWY